MFNYDNIGKKIKLLAFGLFCLESLVSVLCTIYFGIEEEMGWLVLLLPIVVGVLWVMSWPLYAFGELVENSTEMRKAIVHDEKPEAKPILVKLNQNQPVKNQTAKAKESKKEDTKKGWTQSVDDSIETICPYCHEELVFDADQLEGKTEVSCPYCDKSIKVK